MVPRIGIRRAATRPGGGLLQLRLVFISFIWAICLFQIGLAWLLSGSTRPAGGPIWLFVGLVVLSGLIAWFEPRFEKPLDCSSDVALAGSYRTRFFLRAAFAESIAMIAFVGSFMSRVWWLYPLGLAMSLVNFGRLAPTAGHLARDQAVLSEAGCRRLLVRALATPAPSAA